MSPVSSSIELEALGYLSSYSHRGKYYTLTEIPRFDAQGLWNRQAVWFSRYGNLVETEREFVEEAAAAATLAASGARGRPGRSAD